MVLGLISLDLRIIWTHIIMSCALLLHWITNDNKCILSEMECYIMDTTEDKTLTRQLLEPLIDQSSDAVAIGTAAGLMVSLTKMCWLCACPDDNNQW